MATRIEVIERIDMPIAIEDDVILVRRRVRAVAQQCGFDSFALAAIMTAASELGRNVWTHARGGAARIERITDGTRSGLQVEFRDQGPGIADLDRALAGGYSSARSLGLGLSGSRRLVDEFEIETAAGQGTRVKVRKWARI
jgi:serine/threonine-protein kinase RsbT